MTPEPADRRRRSLARLRRAGAMALDLLLPPRCILCAGAVKSAHTLCQRCWRGISFIDQPMCHQCGLPFPFEAAVESLCPGCIAQPPSFDRARAAMVYDEHSRGLILALKHADRQHALPAFGQWLARAGAALLDDADAIVPVPLHWLRLFNRRYNQSALLCWALAESRRQARLPAPPVMPDLLRRRRATPSQGHLGRSARLLNVRAAFAVKPGITVAGRRIVLVDDVMTTGATVDECARVLRRAGAANVGVLTLARTVRVA